MPANDPVIYRVNNDNTLVAPVMGASAVAQALGSGGGTTTFYRADGVFATPPSGGGGLANISSSLSTSSPNNIIPTVSLIVSGSGSDIDLVLSTRGSGSILLNVPDNTEIGGNKRGLYSIDLQKDRYSPDRVVSGDLSAILSGQSNMVTGSRSVIAGGNQNEIRTGYCFIGSGFQNIINCDSSVIAGGVFHQIHGTTMGYCTIGGGYLNRIDDTNSGTIAGGSDNDILNSDETFIGGGSNNIISSGGHSSVIVGGARNGILGATHASILGGEQQYVTGIYGSVLAGSYGWSRLAGMRVHYSYVTDGVDRGKAQVGEVSLFAETTSATPAELSLLTGDAGKLVLQDNSTFSFEAYVTGRAQGGASNALFKVTGTAKRGVGASTVETVGLNLVEIVTRPNRDWNLVVNTNTSNGSIRFLVSGSPTATRWVANVKFLEIVY